ncbi:MAG TPA: PAS domain S-box protein [Nitrospira sp.]|jgi:PAS domain S-box-containing protein|nr:PAS domain S-box protein [Nitrospira sp.]
MKAEQLASHRSSVLIVEDDPDLSLALADSLQHEGYTVHTVMTGRQALLEAEERLFGAVVLDLGLPDLSGFAVLRGLEEMDPLLPVIVLTASIQEQYTVEALRRGAFAYITKPYNRDELKIVLRQAVDVRRLVNKMRRVEDALTAKEEEFRQVVQTAPDGIVLADANGRIVSWNTAAERLFGYTEGEILGQPLTIIMPDRYREDHLRGLEQVKAIGGSTQTGRTIELYGLRKDGREFPIELSLSTWRSRGRMLSCGILRDITLRKEAEAKLVKQQIEQQVLLDLIPAMVWYKDTQNRILRANRHAAESIHKAVEDLEGKSTYDLFPEEAEKYYQDDLAVIASREPKLGIVELYEVAPGQKRWVQTDKVPYRDAQGNVIGVLVFAQDITERRQAEADLQESERQYRLLMEEVSDAIVAIDLDGYFRLVNAKACEIFGYTRDELLHLHVSDTYIPAEKDMVQQCLEQVREGKNVCIRRAVQRKDGTVVTAEIRGRKMSDNRYFAIIEEVI